MAAKAIRQRGGIRPGLFPPRSVRPDMAPTGASTGAPKPASTLAPTGASAIESAGDPVDGPGVEAGGTRFSAEPSGRPPANPGATRTAMRARAYPGEDPASVKPPEVVADRLVSLLGEQFASGWRESVNQAG